MVTIATMADVREITTSTRVPGGWLHISAAVDFEADNPVEDTPGALGLARLVADLDPGEVRKRAAAHLTTMAADPYAATIAVIVEMIVEGQT